MTLIARFPIVPYSITTPAATRITADKMPPVFASNLGAALLLEVLEAAAAEEDADEAALLAV